MTLHSQLFIVVIPAGEGMILDFPEKRKVRIFKSKTSIEYLRYIKNNNLNLPGQIWQRSFHDRVIRNEQFKRYA